MHGQNSASRHKEVTEACNLLGPSVRASVGILWLRLIEMVGKSGPGKSERPSLFKTCLQSSLAVLPVVFDNTSVCFAIPYAAALAVGDINKLAFSVSHFSCKCRS